MVERAAKAAGFKMKIHPHMLRHACGFKLANEGVDTRTIQAYLGHSAACTSVSAALAKKAQKEEARYYKALMEEKERERRAAQEPQHAA